MDISFGAVKVVKKRISPMLKEVLSRFFSKPVTENYPFVKTKVPEDFRGKMSFNFDLCISCGLCSRDCPAQAIEMVDVNGKRKPLFHLDLCCFCYQCAEGCPRNAIKTTDFFELASNDKSSLIIKPETNDNMGGSD